MSEEGMEVEEVGEVGGVDESLEQEEGEARQSGWAPKEEWKGRPEDWVDAKEFNRRGREINSFLKKNNERLKGELAEHKKELMELKLTAEEFKKEFSQMKENAYKKAMADLKAQRREALKEGDHETADLIDEQLDDMKEVVEKLKQPKVEAKPTQEMTEAAKTKLLNAWREDNPWYDNKNADIVDAVDVIGMRLRREQPQLDGRDFLDEVTRIAKKKHPDWFGNPRREKPSMVEGGKRGNGEASGKKTYANLPADAKAQCDKFVKSKMCSQEDYVKNYYEQEGV